jgi:hypothetical protein
MTWSTVNNPWDEFYTVQMADGAGRVYGSAHDHPGSVGGFSAQLTRHDLMGRVAQQSNPTEIYGNWDLAGDDTAGWQYNHTTEYDWKGRVLKTYNIDTYKEASYAGCGCAGGEVVTLTDEMDRQQKVYSDVLGRQWKTEVLNTNGTINY